MKHAEADYIKAGFCYEKAKTLAETQKVADRIKKMLHAEASEDEPRRLVEQGRAEARK
jgi:hypothetical protein